MFTKIVLVSLLQLREISTLQCHKCIGDCRNIDKTLCTNSTKDYAKPNCQCCFPEMLEVFKAPPSFYDICTDVTACITEFTSNGYTERSCKDSSHTRFHDELTGYFLNGANQAACACETNFCNTHETDYTQQKITGCSTRSRLRMNYTSACLMTGFFFLVVTVTIDLAWYLPTKFRHSQKIREFYRNGNVN